MQSRLHFPMQSRRVFCTRLPRGKTICKSSLFRRPSLPRAFFPPQPLFSLDPRLQIWQAQREAAALCLIHCSTYTDFFINVYFLLLLWFGHICLCIIIAFGWSMTIHVGIWRCGRRECHLRIGGSLRKNASSSQECGAPPWFFQGVQKIRGVRGSLVRNSAYNVRPKNPPPFNNIAVRRWWDKNANRTRLRGPPVQFLTFWLILY